MNISVEIAILGCRDESTGVAVFMMTIVERTNIVFCRVQTWVGGIAVRYALHQFGNPLSKVRLYESATPDRAISTRTKISVRSDRPTRSQCWAAALTHRLNRSKFRASSSKLSQLTRNLNPAATLRIHSRAWGPPRDFQSRAFDRRSGDDRTSNQNLPADGLLYLQCTSARLHAVH